MFYLLTTEKQERIFSKRKTKDFIRSFKVTYSPLGVVEYFLFAPEGYLGSVFQDETVTELDMIYDLDEEGYNVVPTGGDPQEYLSGYLKNSDYVISEVIF